MTNENTINDELDVLGEKCIAAVNAGDHPPVSEYLSRVRRELRIYQSGF